MTCALSRLLAFWTETERTVQLRDRDGGFIIENAKKLGHSKP